MKVLAMVLCGAIGAVSHAQTGWQSITFHVQRETPAQRYTIYVDAAGNGSYWEGEPDLDASKVPGGALKAIHLTGAMAKLPFALIGSVGEGNCETHAKNIAQTGQKTLVIVTANNEVAKCTFNWSDDEEINAAANAFQAVAETIRMGERLKHSLRFDRLGLDAEIDSLGEEVKNGYAIELQNIAPTLQSLIEDDRVMERVKRKAGHLLEGAGIAVKTSMR